MNRLIYFLHILAIFVSCAADRRTSAPRPVSQDAQPLDNQVPVDHSLDLANHTFPVTSDMDLVLSADGKSCSKAPKSNSFPDQYITPSAPGSVCHITDAKTLADCFAWNSSFSYEVFQFDNDVACTGDECCPGGGAPIRLGAWGATLSFSAAVMTRRGSAAD